MGIVVLGVILLVLSYVLMGLHKQTSEKTNLLPWAWFLRVISLLLVIGGVILSMVVIIPAGHRGVLLQFGAVKGSLSEGIHLILPVINSCEVMEVRTQKEESKSTAASRDLQIVTTSVALNFHVDPSRADDLYQKVGREYKVRVIDPAVQESLKQVTARYTAEELIKNRAQVKAEVELEITKRLKAYDLLVEPSGLSITNFDFSAEFNRAIEEKQVAQQDTEKQKYVLQRAELEKQTDITRAQGKSQAAKLNAESLKVQGGSLVIAREWIEKWNGSLPSVYSGAGGGQGMIIDLGNLINQGQGR